MSTIIWKNFVLQILLSSFQLMSHMFFLNFIFFMFIYKAFLIGDKCCFPSHECMHKWWGGPSVYLVEWCRVSVGGRWGQDQGRWSIKLCAITRASSKEHRVEEEQLRSTLSPFFPLSWSPVSLPETCPRTFTKTRTPQRWGRGAPSPCWHQEETPKVRRGWGADISRQVYLQLLEVKMDERW